MKFSAENPRLRKAAKRYGQVYEKTTKLKTGNKRTPKGETLNLLKNIL